jgi:ubiquinone/menaquinone biosynthesis C-methylase UbiE
MSLTLKIKNQFLSHGPLTFFQKKRFEVINKSLNDFIHTKKPLKILEVGCGLGRDFTQFIPESSPLEYYGIDINTDVSSFPASRNITRMKADARYIPFPDKFFDIVVSVGMLEHIEPIEDLCKIISEIQRVGKNYCVVVPAVSTLLEPHTATFLWQLRKNKSSARLNFYSDSAWCSFSGFHGCQIRRFYFIPPFITNTIITSPTIDLYQNC